MSSSQHKEIWGFNKRTNPTERVKEGGQAELTFILSLFVFASVDIQNTV